MTIQGACTCSHARAEHIRNGFGRCSRPGCRCLFGPPPARRTPLPMPREHATHRVNDRGEVVVFQRERSQRERLETMLWNRILDAGLPAPERQYRWARPQRQYRSDFAYPAQRILLEVQGGIWARNPGRHNRGSGYQADLERSNLAMQLGWKLLAFTEKMIRTDDAVATIRRALSVVPQSREISQ